MDPERADDVTRRAKIRYDHLLAKRARAEALRSDVASLRADLRMLAADIEIKMRKMNVVASTLASKISLHLDELQQDETTIRLPALQPRDRRERPFLD